MQLNIPAIIIVTLTIKSVNSEWHCGIGDISSTLSYLIALPSDTVGVDRCCKEHDDLYSTPGVAHEEADRIFSNCLEDSPKWWVRNVVKPIFCKSVQVYSSWLSDQVDLFDNFANSINPKFINTGF